VLPPDSEPALVRSDEVGWNLLQSCLSLFGEIFGRQGNSPSGANSSSCPAERLRALVMSIADGPLSRAAADTTLMVKIEARICESGDLEMQQLVQRYLSES